MNNQDWIDRDLSVLWHPCSQQKDYEHLPPIPIKRGKGVWLEDFEGNRYLDAISSWWVNIFGHANPRINAALAKQMETLEHVILAGFSHEAAITLSERLIEVAPPGFRRTFFSDNGSSAVEIALKMSFHYWQNLGKPRKHRFICLENSYHGETLGTLSVGDVALYKETYAPLLLEVFKAPSPDAFKAESGETAETYALRMADEMEKILQIHADEVSAVIVEPLIQCAGDMRMYHPAYLKRLRELCDQYEVHLIADEIAVGFGRTGRLFACEHAEITPDFMCLSKGLTAGYLPLSTVLIQEKVYEAFYDDYETMKAFLHSHSFTGNAMGCRAALATLDIFAEDNIIESNKPKSALMGSLAEELLDHPNVLDVRQHGMVVAIEMGKDKKTKTPFPWQERRGRRVYEYGLKNEMLLRPLGNVVYFMPPYVINDDEIRQMVQVAKDGIHHAVSD